MMFTSSRDIHLVSLEDEVKAREGCLGVISLEVKIGNECEHQEVERRRRNYGQRILQYPHISGAEGTVQKGGTNL